MSTHAPRTKGRRRPKLLLEALENRITPSFTPATGSPFALPTDAASQFVALGDFNEDDNLDVVTANPGTNDVSVFFGAADGTLGSSVEFAAGASPMGVAVGDFNEDNNLDVAVTNHTDPGGITVLFGDGTGDFPTSISFGDSDFVGAFPIGIAVGDFDDDDDLDIAVANSGDDTITTILGVAAPDVTISSFQSSGGTTPQQVAVGDFNGDLVDDLAVAHAGSNDVTVFLGQSLGDLTPAGSPLAVGSSPAGITVGDLDGDSHDDLAVANADSDNVSVLLGDGMGGFGAATNFLVGDSPFGLALADVTLDNQLDIVTANTGSDNVSVLQNLGGGAFGAAKHTVTGGAGPHGIAAGKLDDDIRPDLAVVNTGSNNVSVLLNNTIVVDGTAGGDTLVLFDDPGLGLSYQLNGGQVTPLEGGAPFTFNGLGGDDTLIINNPAGGLFTVADGIFYNGGGDPGDSLQNLGGSANSGSYSVGPGIGDGVITHTNGIATQTITFTGLAPTTDTVAELLFTIDATDAANAILVDDGTDLGDGLIRVSIDLFEPIEFANKTNVTINGGLTSADVSDEITLTNTEASTGLLTLLVNTGPEAGGSSAGDSVIVRSTPAAVTTAINCDGGADTILLEGPDATIDAILGPITIAGNGGPAPGDLLRINDAATVPAAAGFTYTVSSTTVVRTGGPLITYGTIEGLQLDARNVTAPAGNVIDVTSVANNLTATINAGAGNDLVNVSNTLGAVATGAALVVNGEAGNDDLTVDFAASDPTTSGGLTYNGGPESGAPGDELTVVGVSAATVIAAFLPDDANGHRGNLQIGAATINYSDLEPISISGTMADLILNLPIGDGNNQAVVENDGGAADPDGIENPGVSAIRSNNGTFEFTQFTNPTTSLTINTGADGETVTIGQLDAAFTTSVRVDGGAGTDLFRVDFGSGANVIPAAGIDFNGTGNDGVVLLSGGSFTAGTITHSYGNLLGNALITVDGRNIDYSGINETTGVVDQLTANNRIFDFTAASETIQMTDDATPADGFSRIRAAGEAVITDYRNPTMQITVNGDEGSDTFTNPAFDTLGTPPTANLNGRDGASGGTDASDTFTITPSEDTTFFIDADNPTPPATPGDTLTVTTVGTANPLLTIASGGGGLSGGFTFDDRQPVNFQEVESLGNTVNLTITKDDAPDPVDAGATVTYTIIVSNTGPLGVAGVSVTDTFPVTLSNVMFTSVATGGATGNTASGAGNLNETVSLPVGSTITYTVTATVAPNATGTLTNTANVVAPTGATDSNTADNSSTETTTLTAKADLVVTKIDSPDPVNVTGNITYTITLRNDGPSNAQTIALVDDLPLHTTFVSFAAPAGFTPTTPAVGTRGKVRATAVTLTAGSTATFTLVVRVNAQAPGTGPLANVINVSSATTDPSTANNSATASTLINHVSYIAVGAVKGAAPSVTVYRPDGSRVASFLAFSPNSKGGVRVAVGDVNGDGVSDIIVASGPGARGQVKVIDGTKLAGLSPKRVVPGAALLGSFFVYQKGFTGGVFVAAGDVDGDGKDDIITSQGSARGLVQVIDADRLHLRAGDGRISPAALHAAFNPYRPKFKGGVFVAAGDVNGDERADVITGAASGSAPVNVADIANGTFLASFFVQAPRTDNGVSLGAGYANADERADIVIGSGAGRRGRVQVIDGTRVDFVDPEGRITPHAALASRAVFGSSFRGGVQVGAVDLDNDGLAEILAGFGPTKRRILGIDVLRNVTERTINTSINGGSIGSN